MIVIFSVIIAFQVLFLYFQFLSAKVFSQEVSLQFLVSELLS
jgi:hypothetical protein